MMTFLLVVLAIKVTIVACLLPSQVHHSPYRCASTPRALLLGVRPPSVSDEEDLLQVEKSPESNFWRAALQTPPSSSLPAIDGIDRETGPLPPGAYKKVEYNGDGCGSNICLIGVKIRPPANPKQGDDIWTEGVKNCQKMIDSGFNTFSVGNAPGKNSNVSTTKRDRDDRIRQTKRSLDAAKKLQEQYTQWTIERHDSERQFYSKLRQNTPSSVLSSCHFTVDIEVPSILHVADPILDKNKPAPSVPYGNGWAVRKSISDSLLRVKTDCFDSVSLICKFVLYCLFLEVALH